MRRFNWKIIVSDLVRNLETALNLRKELIYAFIVCLIVVGTTAVVKTSTKIENMDEQPATDTDTVQSDSPLSAIETLSIREIALQLRKPVDLLMAVIQNKGYKINNLDDTLEQVAKDNAISTGKLVDLITATIKNPVETKRENISRLGNMTIEEFCDQRNLSLNEILARFDAAGVKVDPRDKLKQIASQSGMSQSEFSAVIEGRVP